MSRLQTFPTPLVLGLALAFGPAAARADDTALAPVTVSASALTLGSDQMSTPASVLAGEELVRRRAATLGETLSGEPGMAASHFGAGASRPIIRGMDGPRVKLLSDGSEIMDASMISPDHAVAIEPMLSEQIEVLRGPSALAYGGGAIGGVVNMLDKRVPTAVPERGAEGSVELRADSVASGVAGAFEVTAGSGNLAFHAEGLKRDARGYRVGSGWDHSRVDGSYNQTETGTSAFRWSARAVIWAWPSPVSRTSTGCPATAMNTKRATRTASICTAATTARKTSTSMSMSTTNTPARPT